VRLDPKRVRDAVAEGERIARRRFPDREHLRESHALVVAALALSDRLRPDIERSCGVGTRTIEDMVSREGRAFTLAVLAPMLADPRVLGAGAHAWFVREWVKLLDRSGVLDQAFTELDEPELEALDVPDTGGFVCQLVRNARDPGSDGGDRITATESRQIRGAAKAAEHELAELAASCDREAGAGVGLRVAPGSEAL
jgi:hypothetical protein